MTPEMPVLRVTRSSLLGSVFIVFLFARLTPATAATVPLPGWTFHIAGTTGSSGATNNFGGITLTVVPNPGPAGGTVQAQSASDILTIAPNTTYVLSAWALMGASSPVTIGDLSLLVNGTPSTNTSISGIPSTYTQYTVAFTTAGSGDSRVGLPLRAYAYVSSGAPYTGTLTLTNITLMTLPANPQLAMQQSTGHLIKLSWRTNYTGFTLESAASPFSASWTPVSGSRPIVGTDFVATLGTTNPPRCFRLRSP